MMDTINRREFLKISSLAGTGIVVGRILGLQPGKIFAFTAAMNESGLRMNMAPIAIADDCAQLVVHAPQFSKRIKESMTEHWEEMRIGSILRAGDKQAVALLNSCRGALKSDPLDEFSAKKIAFTSGWLFHRAANKQLYGSTVMEEMEKLIYHDVYLLNQDVSSERVKAEDAFTLFNSMKQRTQLRLHTFDPDNRDIDNWVSNLAQWNRSSEALLRHYAQVYSAPDPEKMRRYVHDSNFYDSADPVIRMSRLLRQGVTDRTVDLKRAVSEASSQSQYAQALRRGFRYMEAASDYFDRSISEKALRNRLEIS